MTAMESPVDHESGDTSLVSVVVTGALWPLGRRVVERLTASGRYSVTEIQRGESAITEPVDVLVHLAPGDHDALAARGRSAAVGTPELLAAATELFIMATAVSEPAGAILAALSTTDMNLAWASPAWASTALVNSALVPEAMSYR